MRFPTALIQPLGEIPSFDDTHEETSERNIWIEGFCSCCLAEGSPLLLSNRAHDLGEEGGEAFSFFVLHTERS